VAIEPAGLTNRGKGSRVFPSLTRESRLEQAGSDTGRRPSAAVANQTGHYSSHRTGVTLVHLDDSHSRPPIHCARRWLITGESRRIRYGWHLFVTGPARRTSSSVAATISIPLSICLACIARSARAAVGSPMRNPGELPVAYVQSVSRPRHRTELLARFAVRDPRRPQYQRRFSASTRSRSLRRSCKARKWVGHDAAERTSVSALSAHSAVFSAPGTTST